MPTITVKTEYIDKLKSLGVYDAWLSNLKLQWKTTEFSDPGKMYTAHNLQNFVNWSFLWSKSPEGHDYWSGIANSPP